jgi:hypothetical protein
MVLNYTNGILLSNKIYIYIYIEGLIFRGFLIKNNTNNLKDIFQEYFVQNLHKEINLNNKSSRCKIIIIFHYRLILIR